MPLLPAAQAQAQRPAPMATPRNSGLMTRANRPDGNAESAAYLPVERLREQYINYLTVKMPEIEEQKEARRYYHGAQWSADDIRILRKRKQPIITYNRIGRKINGIIGLVERVRQDPKGFPRSPNHEEGAEVATTTVREILDGSDWKTQDAECIRHCAIDGISGVEMRLIEGDHGDPDIDLSQVFGDDYFYDPRSYRYDFSDARYDGIGKWVDIEEAIELFPDKEEILRGLIQAGSDLTTRADREFKWVLSTEHQLRLVEHWYRHKGQWCWAFYVSNVLLDQGVSPFKDEKGKTMRRYIMFSAAVDHDGDRYGFVRNLKGPQDEVNQRRSKGLHLSNSRRLLVEQGAVEDIEKIRTEWAKADGVVEVKPGTLSSAAGPKIKADDSTAELAAQANWYKDAKDEIDQFAQTNVATLTQGALQNLSGRAINLLQQPGLAELGPFLLAIRGWRLRVYRAVFNAAQQHWTAERWIRVTDDGVLAKFLQINGMELDQYNQPVLVNALGALDVDITLDEGPDVVNMMQDTYDILKGLPPGSVPPAVLMELAPIQGSVKQKIAAMMAPPPADPLDAAAKQLTVAALQAQVDETRAEIDNLKAAVIGKRAAAVRDVMTAAMNASKAGIPGAPAADLGIQSAPITPAPGELGSPMPMASPQPQEPGPASMMPPPGMPRRPPIGSAPPQFPSPF
jgi:hypothetical protein